MVAFHYYDLIWGPCPKCAWHGISIEDNCLVQRTTLTWLRPFELGYTAVIGIVAWTSENHGRMVHTYVHTETWAMRPCKERISWWLNRLAWPVFRPSSNLESSIEEWMDRSRDGWMAGWLVGWKPATIQDKETLNSMRLITYRRDGWKKSHPLMNDHWHTCAPLSSLSWSSYHNVRRLVSSTPHKERARKRKISNESVCHRCF